MKTILSLLLVFAPLACTSSGKTEPQPEKPFNIIFMIGDGMGLSAISTGFYYGDRPSVFNRFKEIGLQRTSSAREKVTDSAASGTAMATGVKTNNGAIGLDAVKEPVQNIVELVSAMGWSTGVVATSTISHATPASFYAHVESRMMEEDIAAQLLDSDIDFFAGGGRDKFTKRRDSTNLLLLAAGKGFDIDTTTLAAPGTLNSDHKYGFLTKAGSMPNVSDGRGNFLTDATVLAISHLSQNQKGFFLMVEGSQIDGAGHANNSGNLIAEMLDFEKAISAALEFAEKDGNTLVVVTADHETGGLALGPGKGRANQPDNSRIEPIFATTQHTATLIPLFAFGPGAVQFKGIYENTEIFHKMASLAKGD